MLTDSKGDLVENDYLSSEQKKKLIQLKLKGLDDEILYLEEKVKIEDKLNQQQSILPQEAEYLSTL